MSMLPLLRVVAVVAVVVVVVVAGVEVVVGRVGGRGAALLIGKFAVGPPCGGTASSKEALCRGASDGEGAGAWASDDAAKKAKKARRILATPRAPRAEKAAERVDLGIACICVFSPLFDSSCVKLEGEREMKSPLSLCKAERKFSVLKGGSSCGRRGPVGERKKKR